jgi:hypothetical protein
MNLVQLNSFTLYSIYRWLVEPIYATNEIWNHQACGEGP